MGITPAGLFARALKDPILVGLGASLLCTLGITIFISATGQIQTRGKRKNFPVAVPRNEWNTVGFARASATSTTKKKFSEAQKRFLGLGKEDEHVSRSLPSALISVALVMGGVLLFTNSFIVSVPFGCIAGAMTFTYSRNRASKANKEMLQVWPEVVDLLITGLQAGLSLTEALASLATRGPEIVRADFSTFKSEILQSGDFAKAVRELKHRFHSHASDQILEAILMAKSMGGSELLEVFRLLGEFLRQDLSLRKEIEIKHGWIKNSAHLSSVAPWLLLLLLSSQPGTVEAFSQPGGIFVLSLGLIMTLIAYVWMGRLSRLPAAPRVFDDSRLTSLRTDLHT